MLFHRQAEHRKLTEIITDLKKEKAKMLELINRQTILIQELKAKDANALPVADAEELRERLRFVETVLEDVGIDVRALRQNEGRWKTAVDLISYKVNVPAIGQMFYINQYQIDADLRYLSSVLTKLDPDEIKIKTVEN